jgi:diguanylate cyclase (GGDEF)-like protein
MNVAPFRAARLASSGPTGLDQRLGLLLIVRVVIVGLVVVGALGVSSQVGYTIGEVGPISAAYLIVAGGTEWYRRRHAGPARLVHRLLLPLDGIYLAAITTPGGGPRSQLIALVAIQLIAVTLLASRTDGMAMALWDGLVFGLIWALSLSDRIGSALLGVKAVPGPGFIATAVAVIGFAAIAVCTAFFSTVSERELRRAKAELEALADMAAELEMTHDEDEILSVFLRSVVAAFPLRRGALWWTKGDRLSSLSLVAAETEVVTVPVEGRRPNDRVALEALQQRSALVATRLDSDADPVASQLLPGANDVVVVPLEIERGDCGVALLERSAHRFAGPLPGPSLVMLTQFGAHTALSLRNARLLQARERAASIDGLTGLANRREFDKVLAREVSLAARTREPLSVVVVDVDHFKRINDTMGHLAGDEVLRACGATLAAGVRESDVVARYGGEEFAIVLPRCDAEGAAVVVDRIRAEVAGRDDLGGITISAGVASMPDHASELMDLLSAADEAMYRAKRSGRDRVAVSLRQDPPTEATPLGA